MTPRQSRFWDAIRIVPEKWRQSPYGDDVGGFWAVALIGRRVVWYNDIEDGFSLSRYSEYGSIGEYWSNQEKLETTVQRLINIIDTGYDIGGNDSPPRAGEFHPR